MATLLHDIFGGQMVRSTRRTQGERGAAAVEFALVATLLITLLLGIIEFGYLFMVQGTLAGAAREGAREYAIHKIWPDAQAEAVTRGASAGVTAAMVALDEVCPATVPPGGEMPSAVVTITIPDARLTGFFGEFELRGTGAMRCNG